MYIECVLLVVKGFVDFSVFVKKLIEENLKGWTVESIKIMWYVFFKNYDNNNFDIAPLTHNFYIYLL